MANVTGPASSTNSAIPTWNGTSGTAIQNTGVTIDGSNNIAGLNSISSDGGSLKTDGSGNITATSFIGPLTGLAESTSNIRVSETDYSGDVYPVLSGGTSGDNTPLTSGGTGLTYNPSTGTFSASVFSGELLVTGSTAPANGIYLPSSNTVGIAADSLLVATLAGVASAVNYIALANNTTGNAPTLSAVGSDTNIGLSLSSKGTGSIAFFTEALAKQQFAIADTASAVNYPQVAGAATGSGPTLSAQGSDTNVALNLNSKGTGAINLQTGGTTQAQIANTSSAVNYPQITGNTTGNAPSITAVGSDTNISLNLVPKGTGNVQINGVSAPNFVQGQASGFVNAIRNPQMAIAQRGTSSTSISTSTAAYCLDGWLALAAGASSTWSQGAALELPNDTYAANTLKITGAASNTSTTLTHRIESFDAMKLAGQTVTFQATFKNSSGATLTPTLTTKYPGSADTWTSSTTDLSSTNLTSISNGNTTTVAYTFTVSENAYLGYEVIIGLPGMTSTSDSIQMTAVDLRATPGVATGANTSPPVPEFPSIQADLARNQRYLYSVNYYGSTEGSGAQGAATSSTAFGAILPFPVPMRIAPTGMTVANATDMNVFNYAAASIVAVATLVLNSATRTSALLTGTATGLTTATPYYIQLANTAANITFTGAEL